MTVVNAIIPKFLFEDEDIIYLKDKGIRIIEGKHRIGKYKIPCYKFLNMNENQVFDELERNSLLEEISGVHDRTAESQKMAFANRSMSILFLKIREASALTDTTQRTVAACSLMAAVNSLACLNINYAKRFLPILRGL